MTMRMPHTLEAAQGLALHLNAAPHWRLAWRESDWLGPIGLALNYNGTWHLGGDAPRSVGEHSADAPVIPSVTLRAFEGADNLGPYRGLQLACEPLPFALRVSVRAYGSVPVLVFRSEVPDGATGLSTGTFERPSVAWPTFIPAQRAAGGVPAGTRSYGHQYTEFALPVSGDGDGTGFRLAPHRPPIVAPLLFIAPDGRTLLLAPLDQFHEQVIVVPTERVQDGIRCGWHGDLAAVPAGFATELSVWAGAGPRQTVEAWGSFLQRRHGTQRPSRYADDGVGKLSYWTDNGAFYYYRTEPGCDYPTTLGHVASDLQAREIPVRAVQVDSWFYPQEQLRPVSPEGAPLVPPSGMIKWEPRDDLFPDGFTDLQRQLGSRPLIFHSRHFSSQSPYWARHAAWIDREYAHPADAELYDLLMAQAASWGAVTYEQDWMVESFLRVRGLRAAPGRARAWQEHLDRAAGEHGLTLQWCMATPADFLETVRLRHVTSIRTSGDYRYLFDNGFNWVWFLHTNALARALGLQPFKDTFISNADPARGHSDPYAEAEALLASLSTGPVAIGDQIGCADRDLVLRSCREDGVLIKPDVPLAALDRCFGANSFLEFAPLVGECFSTHPAGRWVYVASFNASHARQPLHCRVDLADLGAQRPHGPVLAYAWRSRTWRRLGPEGGWDVSLPFQEWDYQVLCPLLPGDLTVFGDVGKYATVGDRRVARITATPDGVRFTVLGAPRTWVEVHGYCATRPKAVTADIPGACRTLSPADAPETQRECWCWDPETGRWLVRLFVGPIGHTRAAIFLQ